MAGGVVYMKWSEYRREITFGPREEGGAVHLYKADVFGFIRAVSPWIESSTLWGHTARQPPGQSCPMHSVPSDVLFAGLAGEFEFRVPGRRFRLAPLDLLMLPNNMPYVYSNFGMADALFFDILERTVPRAPTTYFGNDAEAGEFWRAELDKRGRPGPDDGAVHMKWEEYRSELAWDGQPEARQWGFHRGVYPAVEAGRFRAQMVRFPAGQRSRGQTPASDHFVIGTYGECEVVTRAGVYGLEPLDLLMLPAGMEYSCRNIGLGDALYLAVSPRK